MNTHQDVASTNKHAARQHVIAVNNHKNKPTYNQTIDAFYQPAKQQCIPNPNTNLANQSQPYRSPANNTNEHPAQCRMRLLVHSRRG